MQFQLPFHIKSSTVKMQHSDAVMLCGSCFTENIGDKMSAAKMNTCMNPQGILFNPMSIATCLNACMDGEIYTTDDLFQLNEVWNHWQFHSRFSNTEKGLALSEMNGSIQSGHSFLKKAQWLIITFGSSFQYFLNNLPEHSSAKSGVGNCHKAPGNWFEKRMLSLAEMQQEWVSLLNKLHQFNPDLQVVFTVSPVRHYRDGLVENNLSKARLFELIHGLTEKNPQTQYFPAFEIVNDVLRDYRFFEQDMVHPNISATEYVWEQFVKTYFDDNGSKLLLQIQEIATAFNHKPRFKETQAHHSFRENLKIKVSTLKDKFSYLDFDKEIKDL